MKADYQPIGNKELNGGLDLDFALRASGIGVWEVDPATNTMVWDDRCRALFGIDATKNQWSYAEAARFIHPEDLPGVDRSWKLATELGADGIYDQTFRTIGADDGVLRWIRFHGKSYFNADGELFRFAGVAQDVTTQQTASQKVELENQIKTFVLDSCNLIIGISDLGLNPEPDYNNAYTLSKLGWKTNVNRTLLDAVYPDDREKVIRILPGFLANEGGSEEIRLWNEVTGEPFWVEWNVMVIKDPATNQPIALATISPDITERKLAQLHLEEREAVLKDAVDIAQLGTWSMNLATQASRLSPRYRNIFGITGNDVSLKKAMSCIAEQDAERVSKKFIAAQQPGSNGKYHDEFTILNATTGEKQIIQAVGKIYFDLDGRPDRIVGIVHDVTFQRELQLSLEALVEKRTQELAVTNEELAASNEEYTALNEELTKSNGLLVRSNNDLQRFAYVASHDLQEPLRKIQQFGGLLQDSVDSPSPKTTNYLERMQSAAKRMSVLIEDLLSFSRVSAFPSTDEHVPLNKIVALTLSDLEFVIQETASVVTVAELPMVRGNATQLAQLFQNLISNALKFRKLEFDADAINTIHISAHIVRNADLPAHLKPARLAQSYHLINVADNGIGFNEVHLDRIFQVFQRLHGRSEYQGTGIGLAICEKVVSNHGGAITASSTQGQGATFHVYLPVA